MDVDTATGSNQEMAMKKHKRFIKENTTVLLQLLKDWQSATLDNQKSAAVIDRILETYSREFIGHKLPTPERRELAFWFTLYQLEEAIEVSAELKENPLQSQIILPYLELVEKNLAITSKTLRKNRVLPLEFYATRPGSFGDDFDDVWDLPPTDETVEPHMECRSLPQNVSQIHPFHSTNSDRDR
jgi:hypothetical protein